MSAGGLFAGAIDARERDLLERLGLDERATPEDIARTRDELQAFLAAAPKSIRGWARRQAAAADEAYVLLSDPTALPGPGALLASSARSASPPGGPATPPVRRATPTETAVPAVSVSAAASEGDEDAAFEAMLADVTPSMHRDRIAQPQARIATKAAATSRAATAATATPRVPTTASRRRAAAAAVAASEPRRFPRILAAMAGVAVLAVAIVAIYQFGATPPATGAQSTPAPTPALDEALVATLMGRIQADPSDTAALLELGDAFFNAEDFETAATWLEKLLVLEPDNVSGLLALGASYYNLGRDAEAKAEWLAVLELEPDNVYAHYDLGFLYLNQTPPDYAAVRREWAEVVRLDPDSELAAFVTQHLEALPAASAAPSAEASDGASPAPSAAASTDPSATPTAAPTAAPSATVMP
ncbi:MAG: tetratricopeptide repeat protein [Chloroflexi bacterium]|nr:tetratricopeptide repeat protein [Chloroflexota bacterium]